MLHIDYRLAESKIHGIGLFADQDIQAGQVVYTASPLLDLDITDEQFQALSERERQEIRWWGFFDVPTARWHVDFDMSKFINHSPVGEATLTQDESHTEAFLVATRAIKKGEELTQNYAEFESAADMQARGISDQDV